MTKYLTSHQLIFLKTKKREAQHPQPQLIPVREETEDRARPRSSVPSVVHHLGSVP
jgi:hypothetical protein